MLEIFGAEYSAYNNHLLKMPEIIWHRMFSIQQNPRKMPEIFDAEYSAYIYQSRKKHEIFGAKCSSFNSYKLNIQL